MRNKLSRLAVKEANYDFTAAIFGGVLGEDVVVSAKLFHGQEEVLSQVENMKGDPVQSKELFKKLQLQPGNNVIEIVTAANRTAAA